MKVHFLTLLSLFIFLSEHVTSQSSGFFYKNLDSRYRTVSENSVLPLKEYETAVDLTSVLPQGHVRDGSVDYTRYLQGGLDKYRLVKMPNFPILINNKGLKVRDSSTIIFQAKSVLKLKSSNASSYSMLSLIDVKDVTIVNAVLVGERIQAKGRKGQWGMGISVKSSRGISLINGRIINCWGDGIYLGEEDKPNNDVLITNYTIDNCRRNGISIISADGVEIRNTVISNTHGHNPMAGIDIEPNNSKNVINNIKIVDVVTYNNKNYGIVVSLERLMARGITSEVNIVVNRHIDEFANTGFMTILGNKRRADSRPLRGSLVIKNPVWKSNLLYPFRTPLTYNNGIKINISNPQISNSILEGKKDVKIELKELNKRYDFLSIN